MIFKFHEFFSYKIIISKIAFITILNSTNWNNGNKLSLYVRYLELGR